MAYDLRFALRMIFTHRWFSAAVVATLAMGIGLNTMVFTLVNAVLLKPVAVTGEARLVAISNRNLMHSEHTIGLSLPLAAVGLFACWLPARRAAALDPVKAIRYE